MIPRTVHHIWASDDHPFDGELVTRCRLSWMRHHPDWNFMFWRIGNLPLEKFYAGARTIVMDPENTVVTKSNVIRFELLRIFGGVYVDSDLECFANVEPLLKRPAILCELYEGRVWTCLLGFEAGDMICAECSLELSVSTLLNPKSWNHAAPGFSPEKVVAPILTGSGYPVLPKESMSVPSRQHDGALWFHHRTGRMSDGWQHTPRYS